MSCSAISCHRKFDPGARTASSARSAGTAAASEQVALADDLPPQERNCPGDGRFIPFHPVARVQSVSCGQRYKSRRRDRESFPPKSGLLVATGGARNFLLVLDRSLDPHGIQHRIGRGDAGIGDDETGLGPGCLAGRANS